MNEQRPSPSSSTSEASSCPEGLFAPSGSRAPDITASKPISQPLFAKIQIVLAIKRTALTVFRTGLAVCAVPLSITSFLIATSRYYSVDAVAGAIIPLGIFNFILLVIGVYLIGRSTRRFIHQERILTRLKCEYPEIRELF